MESLPLSGRLVPPAQPHDPNLLKAAQKLEASFLAEMLKSAGYGEARESLGGGAGEEQFASLLVDAQAEQMVLAGRHGFQRGSF